MCFEGEFGHCLAHLLVKVSELRIDLVDLLLDFCSGSLLIAIGDDLFVRHLTEDL